MSFVVTACVTLVLIGVLNGFAAIAGDIWRWMWS